MKKIRKDSAITRQLLLKAGYKIFCDKGFRDATIAEICSAAGTNVASVNYHFGDKDTLYRDTWLYAYNESVKNFPIDGGVAESADPEERLRGYIRSFMKRIISEPSDLAIMHKEISNPTGLLSDLIKDKINLQFEKGKNILRAFLGDEVAERDIHFCHSSILGQCFHIGASRRNKPGSVNPPDKVIDVEAYCEHVIKFSLAGLNTYKKEIKSSEKINEEK